MKYLLHLVVIFLLTSSVCMAQDVEVFSADRFFNLGNAAYKADDFDDAIYYYEKARMLDPGSEDIIINLQLANERLSTDIIELDPFFLATWWNSISGLLLPGGWKVLSIVFLLALLLVVYMRLFKAKLKENNVFYSLVGLLVATFLIAVLAGCTRSNQIFHSPYVIVFGDDQSLHLGPDVVSEEVKQITGGNKLKVLDQVEGWYKVSAMDSEQGWIRKENVKHLSY